MQNAPTHEYLKELISLNTRLDELGEKCEEYLIDNGFTHANKIDSVSNRITLSIKNNAVFYQKFKAEFID